jgi:hypothetical protein
MSLEIMLMQEDALANHHIMNIPTFPGMTDLVNTNLRIITTEVPDKQIDTYEVTYGGRKATRVSGIVGTANEITFSYRADKYMHVYKGFMAWMELIQSSQTATGLGDAVPIVGGPSLFRVPITLQTAEADQVPSGTTWVFNGAFPSSHGAVTFDQNSGDPLEVSCTLQFIDILYPVI